MSIRHKTIHLGLKNPTGTPRPLCGKKPYATFHNHSPFATSIVRTTCPDCRRLFAEQREAAYANS